mgnify:CR=1 FL=1
MLRPIVRPVVGPLVRRVTDLGYGGWSPLALFASGEQGALYDYDPSDLSTLYQDSVGTTPVTALGQPVGLMLDKRKGLARGAERVTNGDFSDGETGWSIITTGANSITIADGAIHFQTTGADAANAGTVASLTLGMFLEVSFEVLSGSTGKLKVLPFGPSGEITFTCTPGIKTFRVATGSAGAIFMLSRVVGQVADARITNISVRELPGNHASQPTSAARPIYAAGAKIDFDAVDDKLTTTFPDLGSNVTIARSIPGVGASILTGQTIGAGAWDDSTDHCGLLIIDRALTAAETALVTAYLNRKAGV